MRPYPLVMALFLGLPGLANCAPPANYDDATLRAVRFVDKQEGWAVGDQGVIWHTIDGGKTWERQVSGTRASLRAVQFLTPYLGFVVGRTELPHGAGSHGIMLSTIDGGTTWREVTSSLLPGLNAVQFFDENRGVVAGDCTDAFPSGVFSTSDGGKSWKMLPGSCRGMSWHQITMTDLENGNVSASIGLRVIKGGTLIGDPLDCSLRSPSIFFKRGFTVPLCGEQILDKQHGWAVGGFGTILGTTDGATWSVLKSGGQRAAVLFVHARPTSLPLGAVAQLGKDGYLTAMRSITSVPEPRLSAALRSAGGTAATNSVIWYDWSDRKSDPTSEKHERTEPARFSFLFSRGDPSLEEFKLNRVDLPRQERDQSLLNQLVLFIRVWQPEVVVTDLLSPDAPFEDQFVLLHMKDAFEQAADPKAFPEHMEKFGLKPHAAKKLYALAPATGEANVTLDFTKFVPEFGGATKDFVEPAAALLSAPNPDGVRFRLISHRLPGAEKHTNLMDGIHLAEGGTARRKAMTPVADVAEAEKATQLRRRLEDVMMNPTSVGGLLPALSQVIGGLSGLPDELAARTAVGMGRRLAEMGQWTTARELFAVVAEKYAVQPDAVEAIRWLLRYQASGEVRRRIELGHQPVYQRAAFMAIEADAVQQVSYTDAFTAKPLFRFTGPEALKQWHQACLDLEPKLAAFGAAYTRDPANNLSTLAARRQLGLNLHATKQLEALRAGGANPILDDEHKLLTSVAPERAMAQCKATAVRPMLDGKLDDECWKTATPIATKTVDGYPTEARFASDEKFLYVAVTCGHPEGKQVPKVEKRGRDADLTGHDRVELMLDMDRDYQTYYRLRVDQRGAVAEDCWGDAAWNPRWFVANDSTATGWTMEVAIPWAELTGTPPTTQVWAMNVVRVVPSVGVVSWGGSSDATPTPMAMGLLKFLK